MSNDDINDVLDFITKDNDETKIESQLDDVTYNKLFNIKNDFVQDEKK